MTPQILSGLLTAALIVVYLGIFLWAWTPGRKRDFAEAARLPLCDADPADHGAG